MSETYFENEVITDKKFQEETIEGAEFVDCEFRDCSFEECNIIRCVFVGCRFYHCTVISLRSKYSEVKNTFFEKCNLIGVHWSELLPAGRYAQPIERFEHCFMKYNTFTEMNSGQFGRRD